MNPTIAVTLAASATSPIGAPTRTLTPPFFTSVATHNGVAVQHATTRWQWVGDGAEWFMAPHLRCATIAYESQQLSAKHVWPCVRVATWAWLMRQQQDTTRMHAVRGKPLIVPPTLVLPQSFSPVSLWQAIEETVCRWQVDPGADVWQCL